MKYKIKIIGCIPVSEFDDDLLYFSKNMKFIDKNIFDLNIDNKTLKINKIGVYGDRFVDCYSYALDISELVTDISFETNDFFTTKKSSNISLSFKNIEINDTKVNKKLNRKIDYLYNIFVRVGAYIQITTRTSFEYRIEEVRIK